MNDAATVSRPAWLGIDVSKRTFDAAVHPPWEPGLQVRFADLPKRSFERTPEGAAQLAGWLDETVPQGEVRALMEATGQYSLELAAWLTAARPALRPTIADPKAVCHFIRSLRLRNKTDRTDAAALARYGAERSPEPSPAPAPEYATLRDMSRQRTFIVNTIVAARNRLEEIAASREVAALHRKTIRRLEDDLLQIESLMRQHVKSHANLLEAVRLLDTIPGVAFITAATVLGEFGDLTRFHKARSLSAFAGTSPRRFESGDSVKGKTRMCKQGSPRARQALYLASLAAIRSKKGNALARFYAALVARGKSKMAAIGAVMRKMLVLMRALMVNHTEYHDEWLLEKSSSPA